LPEVALVPASVRETERVTELAVATEPGTVLLHARPRLPDIALLPASTRPGRRAMALFVTTVAARVSNSTAAVASDDAEVTVTAKPRASARLTDADVPDVTVKVRSHARVTDPAAVAVTGSVRRG
jgi:hypothetical protein